MRGGTMLSRWAVENSNLAGGSLSFDFTGVFAIIGRMKLVAFYIVGLAFLSAVAQVDAASMKRVDEREYGKMPDGTVVKEFTLRNGKGMVAKVISYGATLTELQVPDKSGAATNVVLGANSLEEYLKSFNAAAATIGRYGNRIA